MKCPKCQHKNPSDAKFCVACGTHFERRCPNCNARVKPEFLFCKECGHRLGEERSADESSQPTVTAGERRQATALFRDMEMTWWLEQAEALGNQLAGA